MSIRSYFVEDEHVEAMRAAFQKACEALQLNGGATDAVTELVAMKIIELATAGEKNSDRLCSQALSAFSEQRKAS
jgi:hypothetical protein